MSNLYPQILSTEAHSRQATDWHKCDR